VNTYDQYLTVLGEVKTPGRVAINKDNITILEAIGQVGDLTIQGRRDQILVIRQEGNESKTYYVDLRSKDLLSSPVYNLKQNDVVYVQPNKVKQGQSTNNDNSVRSISTWLSISSLLTSIAILITNAVRK
jgi:polysaccharide export outer membrane protein